MSNPFILLPMLASIAYHSTEDTAGGLADLMLGIDRAGAVGALGYIIYKYKKLLEKRNIPIAICGILSLILSESDKISILLGRTPTPVHPIRYLVLHCIWHVSAFYFLAKTQ